MTDLNANALEQDADDDADVVDSSSGRLVGFLSRPLFGRLGIGATSCFGSRVHEYFVTGGTKVRRYMEETNQEIRPSTYLLTYILTCVLLTYFLLIFYLLTYFLLNMSLDCIDLVCHIIKC